ncbi:MAG: Single-stranded DNA-binding protein ssb [Firmicutes bacterium ADurb.Bin419]|jgi:single-strand DNA-binding protein|nr:MAG: Single-stranded DNA-binding protein ssb [Firmicutes bacterium ADurb.Bin419]
MNKIILMGRLTADPEMRHTTTGKSVCSFRLAVKRKFVRQGEQEDTDFFPVTAWEKTGEFCNNYFRKGQQVAVVGRVQNRSWTDDQGNKRIITEVIAEEAHFAESKRDNYSETGFETKQETSGFFPMDDSDDLPF